VEPTVVTEIPAPLPLGPLYVAVAGDRLVRLAFDQPPDPDGLRPWVPGLRPWVSGLRPWVSGLRPWVPGPDPGHERPPLPAVGANLVAEIAEGVARWLATGDGHFPVPVGLDAVGEFRARVYRELRAVPSGAQVTYGELARRSGHPGAARAVGRAMATNPWPLVVPCHRVVPASGGVGNYAGGAQRKRWMLEVEAVRTGRGASGR